MTKEITLIDLIEERKGLIAQMKATADTCEQESRQMNEAEQSEFEARKARIAELDAEIAKRKNTNTNTTHNTMEERASLRRILAAQLGVSGMTAADEKLCQRGQDLHSGLSHNGILVPMESRTALTMGSNGEIGVQDPELQSPILPIENKLVLAKAGARILTGIKGNVEIPVFGNATVAWASETGAAADGTPNLTGKKFSPKRLTAKVMVSKEMIVQENFSIEALLQDIIASAVASKLEATLLGSGASVANTPDGLFGGTIANKGTLSWANVVKMESDIDGATNDNCAYIGHSALIGKMKTTVKDASGAGAFILNDGQGYVNGYKCFGTANVATGLNVASSDNTGMGLAFGDWSKFYVCQFGSLDITVDPYTMAGDGQIRLVLNAFYDGGLAQAGAMSIGSFK